MSQHDIDHDHDHDHDHGAVHSDGEARRERVTTAPAPTVNIARSGQVDARITEISDEAAADLRRHVEAASGGGSRFLWFGVGFLAALIAGAVAAGIFLVVSDSDDDGDVQVDVPAVDVDVDP